MYSIENRIRNVLPLMKYLKICIIVYSSRQCSITTILSGIEDSIAGMNNYCTSFIALYYNYIYIGMYKYKLS